MIRSPGADGETAHGLRGGVAEQAVEHLFRPEERRLPERPGDVGHHLRLDLPHHRQSGMMVTQPNGPGGRASDPELSRPSAPRSSRSRGHASPDWSLLVLPRGGDVGQDSEDGALGPAPERLPCYSGFAFSFGSFSLMKARISSAIARSFAHCSL